MSISHLTGYEESVVETSVGATARGGKLITEYNFTRHGGAIGTISLPGVIPPGAKVWQAYSDVITVPVGATAEIAVNVGSAALQVAAAINGAPWSTVGLKDLSADPVPGTESGYLEPTNTVPFTVNFVISVAALTAGRVIFVVHYDVTAV